MSEYRLEMCDVVKTFPGVKALNHAQLKLKPGTVHALMGLATALLMPLMEKYLY